ncbi:MAG: replication-relaxation family protein [Planctomycetes bacterium]|nr:replication-relaxation family protein [Planctomycetota bacterium]
MVTERDIDIFRSLERTPLTPEQLLRLSETFPEPFPTLDRVQRRLRQLADAGQVRSWRYATTEQGSGPLYYKLTIDAYRILHGHDATLPTKRFLQELPIARHHHTRSLADFLVHTLIAAHRLGIQIIDFHPENTLRIAVGDHALFPDASFSLLLPNGFQFTYHVGLYNSTEPISLPRDRIK